MAAYMLFLREGPVLDPAELAIYRDMNRDKAPDPNLTPLIVYGAIEALEGEAPDGAVLLKFPSVEAAKAWYESPDYQAALKHRKKAADYRAMIIEGL